jgi:hypothetical protein
MKSIKNLDYFRKNEHERATRIGGLVSTLCFAVITNCLILGDNISSIFLILKVFATCC